MDGHLEGTLVFYQGFVITRDVDGIIKIGILNDDNTPNLFNIHFESFESARNFILYGGHHE
jgi:hypothetical protein